MLDTNTHTYESRHISRKEHQISKYKNVRVITCIHHSRVVKNVVTYLNQLYMTVGSLSHPASFAVT